VLIQKLLLEANNILGLIKNNLIQIDYYFVPYASIEDIPPFSGLSRRGASSIAPHQVVENSVTAKEDFILRITSYCQKVDTSNRSLIVR
jgi:hypothetical protein